MKRGAQIWIVLATLTLGAGGLVGQVLLWRELLAVYQGNELITGIILANWLLAEAVGAFCSAKWRRKDKHTFSLFALLSCLFVLFLPASMVAARLVRGWMQIAIGQPVGPLFIIMSSALILAPVSFLHGALFPVMGRLYKQDLSVTSGRAVGKLYVWECLGTLLGGLGLVFYLLSGGHGFRLAAVIGVLTVAVLFFRAGIPRGVAGVVFASLLLLGFFATVNGADRVHHWSLARQFKPFPVLASVSSPYGIWTVLYNDGEYLFVVDGQPTYATPVPDRVWVEAFAHIPLLMHHNPKDVVVIGGGVGGLLAEILQHPVVAHVDYIERDPVLFPLFQQLSTDLTERELQDPRVHLHALDGRLFLRDSESLYDVIWVGASEPSSLHANRYFTVSFFDMLRQQLRPDGILAIGLPGRLTYASADLRHLHASLYISLSQAVGNVRVMPDDGRFIFLASPELPLDEITEEDLLPQLLARGLEDTVGMPRHIEQRVHPGWIGWIEDYFQGAPMQPNQDFRPLGLLHYLAYHQSIHAPWSAGIMRLLRYRAATFAVATLLLLFVAERITRRWRSVGATLQCQVSSTGFAGMLLDLLVIFAFQSVLGSVHIWIGLLMAAFMAGAAWSAAWATGWADAHKDRIGFGLRQCDVALLVLCLLLPGLLWGAAGVARFSRFGSIMVFMVINLLAGAATGMLFPMAGAWRSARVEDTGHTAGRLQAADLVGGWVAGMIGAALLVPLLGVYGTSFFLVGIKVLSMTAGTGMMQYRGMEVCHA